MKKAGTIGDLSLGDRLRGTESKLGLNDAVGKTRSSPVNFYRCLGFQVEEDDLGITYPEMPDNCCTVTMPLKKVSGRFFPKSRSGTCSVSLVAFEPNAVRAIQYEAKTRKYLLTNGFADSYRTMTKSEILDQDTGISHITASFLENLKSSNNRNKWHLPPPGHKDASRSNPDPSSDQPWHQRFGLGTAVSKDFDGRTFRGKVEKYDKDLAFYTIKYEDGDVEEMDDADMQKHVTSVSPSASGFDDYIARHPFQSLVDFSPRALRLADCGIVATALGLWVKDRVAGEHFMAHYLKNKRALQGLELLSGRESASPYQQHEGSVNGQLRGVTGYELQKDTVLPHQSSPKDRLLALLGGRYSGKVLLAVLEDHHGQSSHAVSINCESNPPTILDPFEHGSLELTAQNLNRCCGLHSLCSGINFIVIISAKVTKAEKKRKNQHKPRRR